jgi:hypothetical protein
VDVKELQLADAHTPLQALREGVKNSVYLKSIVLNGRVIGMFGAAPFQIGEPGEGVAWMLASPEIASIRKTFLKEAKREVDAMHEHFHLLVNAVWKRNTVSLRWLHWLGFNEGDIAPLNGEPFVFIYRRKE